MDLNPNSSTNTDREEDKLVEAILNIWGALPLLCRVTVLNLINVFFYQKSGTKKSIHKTSGGKLTCEMARKFQSA